MVINFSLFNSVYVNLRVAAAPPVYDTPQARLRAAEMLIPQRRLGPRESEPSRRNQKIAGGICFTFGLVWNVSFSLKVESMPSPPPDSSIQHQLS